MTLLQQRMLEDLQFRGLSARTQEAYVRAVRQLAAHYHKSPARITEEELRNYFLYIKNVKHYSRSTSTIALCGIKFFYEHPPQAAVVPPHLCACPTREEAPRYSQCRRSPRHSGTPQAPALSGVPDDNLFLWPASARGHPSPGARY
jgi:Phage integrase, N-terminal SAM-like domain